VDTENARCLLSARDRNFDRYRALIEKLELRKIDKQKKRKILFAFFITLRKVYFFINKAAGKNMFSDVLLELRQEILLRMKKYILLLKRCE
jgi:hypothetical protein